MKMPGLRYGCVLLCAAVAATISSHTLAQAPSCPCTIWPPNAVPTNAAVTDNRPIEVGVKFRADVAGFITAVRFFKGPQNTGTHIGHLWSAAGTLLAEGTFTDETASGWQELQLSPAVAVSAQTTYVASYFSDGYFALDGAYFATAGTDAPPLHALQSGVDGPNGVFRYDTSGFPTSAGNSANYWVDVVFQTDIGPDVTPPTVSSVVPASSATGVALSSTVRATFTEAIAAATINASTFEIRDANGTQLNGTVTYDAATRTATFATTAGLLPQSVYTATVQGGAAGVHDLAGNAMTVDFVWSFTTGTPTPSADEGPGGPILVVSSSSNPFSRYYAEILRTEGLNEFTVRDISLVTAAALGTYDVVLLGEIPLTTPQVVMFTDYVSAGGNLVAMRPDKKLASLLGLTDQSATLANAYLKIDTTSPPGAGIVSETIQFHGTADRYAVGDAFAVASLYSATDTATTNPAVTMRAAGANGGHAAAFTFDLARSIVYTRQGNPAWSGQERDNDPTAGGPFIRSDDLFFGAKPGDVQPDWVNLDKAAIPQADEQQRLLANLVQHLNRLRKPLPRFWYLPRGLKAAIVMTGDDHRNGGTVGRFNQFKQLSPANCSVANWECIRGTSYIYTGTPGMDDAASLAFVNEGFEVALHVTANNGACGNWTPASLANSYATELAQFRAALPSVPAPQTNRIHCIVWSDYVTQPKVELANGIRFDTNYYYFPNYWVQDRPGLFTGSAMPMRFADLDGTTIDVYQATTQLTDESGQTYPFNTDALLDRALGPLGYYGVFTTNHHTDLPFKDEATTTVQSALARGVPVVTSKQMLDWLDGRNGSSFGSIAWNPGVLTFTIAAGATANGLTAMVPAQARGGALLGITRDGSPVTVEPRVMKGVAYAFFSAAAGSYVATYAVDDTPPVISQVAATPGVGNAAAITWATNESADSRAEFGTSPTTLTNHVSHEALVTSHDLTLAGLAPLTTYYYRVVSADGGGNTAASTVGSFTMPSTMFAATDTTVADFTAGMPGAQTFVAQDADGEVMLRPTAGSEFFGAALPADWSATVWTPPNGGATVSNGVLTVDGARAGATAVYPADRSLEFVATFGGATFQHVGFGVTFEDAPFAMFTTFSGGGLFARTNSGSAGLDTLISTSLTGSPHRFRIDWTATGVTYSVDNIVVATHAIAISASMRPLISDFSFGGNAVAVDWMRMTPYSAAGTFLSRVFDAGAAVNWGSLSWTAQVPSGTSVAFAVRRGDTALPDATWTAFAPISASGGAIGGSSRYLQYGVDLASGNPVVTPSVESVTVGYSEIPLNHAPVAVDDTFSGLHAPLAVGAPGVLANDSDADGDSMTAILVSGTAHGTIALQSNGAFTFTPSAGFSGTDAFTYKANDGRADSSVATVSIAIAATTFTATDTTVGDFGAGTPDAEAYVARTGDGEVILRPAAGSELSGTTVPADWTTGVWSEGGAATLSGGSLTADAAWAGTAATYPAGRSLEFVATFTGAPYQHVGLGETFDTAPWAIVSTFAGGGLFARTWSGGTPSDTPLSSALLGSPHRFRIDWTATGVTYSVDGAVVSADAIAIAGPLRPLISDFAPGDGALTVDWIRMSPYAGAATFLSRVVDASTFASWGALSWTAQVPAGTSVVFAARHGDTAVPDATWTAFAHIAASGGAIGGNSRYAQYRVELASSNPEATPSVEEVSIAYSKFTPNHVPVALPDSFSGDHDVPLTIAAPGVLANDTDADGEPLTAILVSGPAHGTVSLQSNGGFTYTPAAGISGTDAFTYKASDRTDDSSAATVSIVIGATPFTVTDTTVADFNAGTPDAESYIAQATDGEVILRPAAGSEFSGTTLPPEWTSSVWNEGGGVALAGGALTADGASVGTAATYPAGRSLEFVATFTGAPYQHVGFSQTFENGPWAAFSTFAGGGLFARTSGATSMDTPLSSALLGSPHRFRIDWTATDVTYAVDGAVVATHAIGIDTEMRPLISDFTPNDGALTVDWIRTSPYAATATFLSRVVDAHATAYWGTLAWTAEIPPGTSLAFSVRRGDTPTPDATWTAFAPIAASGGTIGGSARYLQYRIQLTSGDPAVTPSVAQITVGGSRF